MDIVRIARFISVKASFENLAWKQKFFLIIFLISFITTLLPHETFAESLKQESQNPVLVFDQQDTQWQEWLEQKNQDLEDKWYQEQVQKQALRQAKLAYKVQEYLKNQRSPLADYAPLLVSLKNWKKIVALSNAESTLCRRYPIDKSNCWGVGGNNLWDMGDNLGEGVINMNYFLNHYPRRSTLKYSQMSFERMNGLYKQPPADHWVNNNKTVYNDLIAIENSL